MQIPVGGTSGEETADSLPTGRTPSLSAVQQEMEQERVHAAAAIYRDVGGSGFTSEALDQIARSFQEQSREFEAQAQQYIQQLPEHVRDSSIEQLRAMSNYLVPYAEDAGAAARYLSSAQEAAQMRMDILGSAEVQHLEPVSGITPPTSNTSIEHEYGLVYSLQSPSNFPIQGTEHVEENNWWTGLQQWAADTWTTTSTFASEVVQDPASFNCYFRKWFGTQESRDRAGDSC
jgi:hypothetical protein